jgi:L-ribulose-5-phosphate 3-epimerase
MFLSRRAALKTGLAVLCVTPGLARKSPLKIGVTDWNLRLTGKLEAVGMAHALGFDGVQVSLGKTPVDGKLVLDNQELQARYIAEAMQRDIKLDGTCLDILHVNYLKNDKLGQKWVADGIRATKGLGVQVMLLPFFGKGALETQEEKDYVGDALRDLAPEAEKAGVILGLENTISAEDNLRIIDRAKSKAVLVYYDVGNSTNNGFDVIKEIRGLGPKRICQFHLKDNPHYLGEGTIDFPMVIHTILTIDYHGYANLETDTPKSVEADMKRNLSYVRQLMA